MSVSSTINRFDQLSCPLVSTIVSYCSGKDTAAFLSLNRKHTQFRSIEWITKKCAHDKEVAAFNSFIKTAKITSFESQNVVGVEDYHFCSRETFLFNNTGLQGKLIHFNKNTYEIHIHNFKPKTVPFDCQNEVGTIPEGRLLPLLDTQGILLHDRESLELKFVLSISENYDPEKIVKILGLSNFRQGIVVVNRDGKYSFCKPQSTPQESNYRCNFPPFREFSDIALPYFQQIKSLNGWQLSDCQQKGNFIFLHRILNQESEKSCVSCVSYVHAHGKTLPGIMHTSADRLAMAISKSHVFISDYEKVLAFEFNGDQIDIKHPKRFIASSLNKENHTYQINIHGLKIQSSGEHLLIPMQRISKLGEVSNHYAVWDPTRQLASDEGDKKEKAEWVTTCCQHNACVPKFEKIYLHNQILVITEKLPHTVLYVHHIGLKIFNKSNRPLGDNPRVAVFDNPMELVACFADKFPNRRHFMTMKTREVSHQKKQEKSESKKN